MGTCFSNVKTSGFLINSVWLMRWAHNVNGKTQSEYRVKCIHIPLKEGFFVLAPHLPNLSQKFLFWFILTFKNSPLPCGISKNHPLGRFGYFLEPWHIYNTELCRWYNVKQIIRIMVYVYVGWELTLLWFVNNDCPRYNL